MHFHVHGAESVEKRFYERMKHSFLQNHKSHENSEDIDDIRHLHCASTIDSNLVGGDFLANAKMMKKNHCGC